MDETLNEEVIKSVAMYEEKTEKKIAVVMQKIKKNRKAKKLAKEYKVSEGKITFCDNVSDMAVENVKELYTMSISGICSEVQKDKLPKDITIIDGVTKQYLEKHSTETIFVLDESMTEQPASETEMIEENSDALTNEAIADESISQQLSDNITNTYEDTEESSNVNINETVKEISSQTTQQSDSTTENQLTVPQVTTQTDSMTQEISNEQNTTSQVTEKQTTKEKTKETTKETTKEITKETTRETTKETTKETTTQETTSTVQTLTIKKILCNRKGNVVIKFNSKYILADTYYLSISDSYGNEVGYTDLKLKNKNIMFKLDTLEPLCIYTIKITNIKAKDDNDYSEISYQFVSLAIAQNQDKGYISTNNL